MDDNAAGETRDVLRPLVSLRSKSEKALEKLSGGTWQHTMLVANIKALRIAENLIDPENDEPIEYTEQDLQPAIEALDSMIDRTENVHTKFAPGSPQHTLQQNRLKALRSAQAAVNAALHKR